MSEQDQNQKPKLTTKLVASLGLSEMSANMSANVANQYFSFFITNILMVNPAVMSIIMTISRIGDFITILLSSVVVEKVNMRWGKFRSFYIIFGPLAFVFFVLQYTQIAPNNEINMIISAACFIISFGLFNFGRTAQMGLNNVLGSNQAEKARLSIRKGQFSSFAPFIFGLIFMPMALFFSGASGASGKAAITGNGLFWAAFVIYAFYLINQINVFIQTKEYDKPGSKVEQKKKHTLSIKEMFAQIGKNRALLFLILGDTFKTCSNTIIMTAAIYYFDVVVNDLLLQPVYATITSLVGIAGALVFGHFLGKIGKRNMSWIFNLLRAGILVLCRFIAGNSVWTFIILIGLVMCLYNGCGVGAVGMYGDCVEYGKHETGVEARGFIMGLFMFPIKLGAVIASAAFGIALSATGYSATVAVTPAIQLGVFSVVTILPAVFCALAAICYFFYPLSEKKMEKIIADNNHSSEE